MRVTQIDAATTVMCPYCRAGIGKRCRVSGWGGRGAEAVRAHKGRIQLAFKVRAYADPLLDAVALPASPCGICGVPGLPQRHRVIDAIAGQLEAGEIWEEISGEMDVTMQAIDAVRAWMKRWPGAWL